MFGQLFLSLKTKQIFQVLVLISFSVSTVFSQGLTLNVQPNNKANKKSKVKVSATNTKIKSGSPKPITHRNSIRTLSLTITGSDNKTNQVAAFRPLKINTKRLTIEGRNSELNTVLDFTPIKIKTKILTIEGSQATPKTPTVNIGGQTIGLGSTLNQPIKRGSLTKNKTIKTNLLTITGKDQQTNQVASFKPFLISTQLLTITGSGNNTTRVSSFSPKQIHTKTLTITGKSSSKH